MGETDAFGRQPVDVWSSDVWVSVTAQRPSPLSISQDEDEIGWAWHWGGGRQTDKPKGEKKEGLHGMKTGQKR